VREPLFIDEIEALEFGVRTPEACRALAAQFAAWAAERHPEDDEEVTPALLLVKAGEQFGFAGDPAAAMEQFRRAAAAEGQVEPDVRCYLHHGLMEVGDVVGARAVAEEIRHSKPEDPNVYMFIAEDYEMTGDLNGANRWLNLALNRLLASADDQDALPDDATMMLVARRRVRRKLGFPPDDPALPPLVE
jgi:tetratricopeptide (TPR) repeat protein